MSELQTQPLEPAAPDESAHADHVYDGITEYDNPIPAWWSWLFIGTIIFSVLYWFVATIANGQISPVASYDRAVIAELKRQGGPLKGDAATLMRLLKDDDSLKAGASIFATNCISCHNRDGSGLIGPNLTDESYINVTKIAEIVDVVTKGRKNGAMPAWGNRLTPNEVVQVAAFAASLRDKHLPGKPPEGKSIPPWSDQ